MKRQSPSHHYDDGGAAKRVTWHNDHVSSSDSDAEQQRAVVYTLDDYRAMVKYVLTRACTHSLFRCYVLGSHLHSVSRVVIVT